MWFEYNYILVIVEKEDLVRIVKLLQDHVQEQRKQIRSLHIEAGLLHGESLPRRSE